MWRNLHSIVSVCLFVLTLATLVHARRLRDRDKEVRCVGKANFTITFWYIPYNPPVPPDDKNPFTGYSPLLCVTHNHRFRLWKRNALLPTPLVTIIQTRNFTDINTYLSEFRNENESVYTWSTSTIIDEDTGQTKVYQTRDIVNVTVDGTANSTWVTCFAALTPSPDWFVGFEPINLCEFNKTNNSFAFMSPELNRELPYQYDGGVDNQQRVGFAPQLQDPPSGVSVRTEILRDNVGQFKIANIDATPIPTQPPEPPKCFPSGSLVRLVNGNNIRIENLQPGDIIDGGDGLPSPVYMISHSDGRIRTQFVRLYFEDGGTLTASAGHYIPTFNGSIVAMDELLPGSHLVGQNRIARIVQRIEMVYAHGLYNPHTMSGNLIVDGTLVTSYTRTLAPRTAHGVLTVSRALYNCGFGTVIAYITERALGTGLLNSRLASILPVHWTQ